MATGLDISGLTLNPKEVSEMAAFISEQVFAKPELTNVHNVQTGITMREKIVFASLFGKMGIAADGSCTRKTSGASSTLTEKEWYPKGIEDTLVVCLKELNPLFKAYFDKIQKYEERYDLSGSDLAKFFAIRIEEAITELVWRAAWLSDENVAVSGAGTAGLTAAANVKFYDYIDGLFAQIFDAVTSGDVERVTIDKNAQTTPALQLALAEGAADSIFEDMRQAADERLKDHPDLMILVSGTLFENQRQYLRSKSIEFTLENNMDGLPQLTWDGTPIVNMATVWDRNLKADFESDSTNNALYLPHRAVMTVKENIPIGTLNESDLSELKIWYNEDDRVWKAAFGFDIDAKLLEEFMIVAAY